MNHFRRVPFDFDPNPLLKSIEKNPDLWKEHTERQMYEGGAHAETESIFIRWAEDKSIHSAFNDLVATDYPALAKLPEVKPLFQGLGQAIKGEVLGRILIVKLKPNGMVLPHVDEGIYADYYERFHLSLQSDKSNYFYVGVPESHGEFLCMRPGQTYWFNHKKTHWVYNGSETDRLHLIIDMVAPEYRVEREEYGIPERAA